MPMSPDITAALERIRAMQRYSSGSRRQINDPIPQVAAMPVDIGELDSRQFAGQARPDDLTEEQINTPVYDSGNQAFGMGPQHTFTAPEAPSKRDRIAAALQKRRQMYNSGAMPPQTRPYGG